MRGERRGGGGEGRRWGGGGEGREEGEEGRRVSGERMGRKG